MMYRRSLWSATLWLALVALLAALLLSSIPARPAAAQTAWAPGVSYAVGAQVTYAGKLYQCLQAHTSQYGWEPPYTPALWKSLGGGTQTATRTRTNTSTGPIATPTKTRTRTRTRTGSAPIATPTKTHTKTRTVTKTSTPSSTFQVDGYVFYQVCYTNGVAEVEFHAEIPTGINDSIQFRWDYQNDGVFDTSWSGISDAHVTYTNASSGQQITARVQANDSINFAEDLVAFQITTCASFTPTPNRITPTATPEGVPAWAPNTFYPVGARVTYAGVHYQAMQAHTSQTGFEPPNVPALWRRL